MKRFPVLSSSAVLVILFVGIATIPVVQAAEEPVKVVDASQLDKQPELRRPVKIRFRKKGVDGKVVLRFVVNKAGDVQNLVIVSFSDPDFVEPACSAYEDARYRPGMQGGVEVATQIEVTVEFPQR